MSWQPVGSYRRARYYRVVFNTEQRAQLFAVLERTPTEIHSTGPYLNADHQTVPGRYVVAFTAPEDDAVLVAVEDALRQIGLGLWKTP